MRTKTFLINELNRNTIENIFEINFDTVTFEIPFEYKYFIAQDNDSQLVTFKYLCEQNKISKVKIKLTKSINKNFGNKIHYYLQFNI